MGSKIKRSLCCELNLQLPVRSGGSVRVRKHNILIILATHLDWWSCRPFSDMGNFFPFPMSARRPRKRFWIRWETSTCRTGRKQSDAGEPDHGLHRSRMPVFIASSKQPRTAGKKTGPYWLRCGRNRPLSWRKRFLMFSDGINQDWENSSKDSSCRAQVRRQIDFAKGVDK